MRCNIFLLLRFRWNLLRCAGCWMRWSTISFVNGSAILVSSSVLFDSRCIIMLQFMLDFWSIAVQCLRCIQMCSGTLLLACGSPAASLKKTLSHCLMIYVRHSKVIGNLWLDRRNILWKLHFHSIEIFVKKYIYILGSEAAPVREQPATTTIASFIYNFIYKFLVWNCSSAKLLANDPS